MKAAAPKYGVVSVVLPLLAVLFLDVDAPGWPIEGARRPDASTTPAIGGGAARTALGGGPCGSPAAPLGALEIPSAAAAGSPLDRRYTMTSIGALALRFARRRRLTLDRRRRLSLGRGGGWDGPSTAAPVVRREPPRPWSVDREFRTDRLRVRHETEPHRPAGQPREEQWAVAKVFATQTEAEAWVEAARAARASASERAAHIDATRMQGRPNPDAPVSSFMENDMMEYTDREARMARVTEVRARDEAEKAARAAEAKARTEAYRARARASAAEAAAAAALRESERKAKKQAGCWSGLFRTLRGKRGRDSAVEGGPSRSEVASNSDRA